MKTDRYEGFDLADYEKNSGGEVTGPLIAEVKRLLDKEADVIEYVTPLLATPDVLKQLMGSPSQIHTIVNLTASLEHLLYILRNGENE